MTMTHHGARLANFDGVEIGNERNTEVFVEDTAQVALSFEGSNPQQTQLLSKCLLEVCSMPGTVQGATLVVWV